jgi:hypothetical protein
MVLETFEARFFHPLLKNRLHISAQYCIEKIAHGKNSKSPLFIYDISKYFL